MLVGSEQTNVNYVDGQEYDNFLTGHHNKKVKGNCCLETFFNSHLKLYFS